MQCVILAGGLATRMRPLTEKVPKALLEAAGRPFADHQLTWLARHGVTEVVFSIAYKGEMIRKFVGDGSRWGLKVRYVDEGTELRGTAGALRLALDQGVLDPKFLMTYGDSFLPVDFGAVWNAFLASGAPALMTVFKNEGQWDTSNVVFRDGQIKLYDKFRTTPDAKLMEYIDYGLSAFDRSVIETRVPQVGKSDLAELFNALSLSGQLAGMEVKTRFYEIGSPQGLKDFDQWLAQHRMPGSAP
ncbi:nucleotidyltransferase family protein [Bdellovibrionota bacterium FG-2]